MDEMNYEVQADACDFDVIETQVEAFCVVHALADTIRYNMQLIFEEIITNIVKYGVQMGERRLVHAHAHCNGDKVHLMVKDNTMPFDPQQHATQPNITLTAEEREIGGLGLFLVGCLVESSSYRREGDVNFFEATLLRP